MDDHSLMDKTIESIHQLDLKIVELQADIRSMREHNDDQLKSLSDKLDRSIETDTKRLDAHSEQLDDHSEKIAGFNEWKKQFAESVRNRLVASQSACTIAAVIIAYLLSKFL